MPSKEKATPKMDRGAIAELAYDNFHKVLRAYSSHYFVWPAFQNRLLESLATAPAPESLGSRANFIVHYVEHLLPKQLEMIGSSVEEVKAFGDQWQTIVRDRDQFEVAQTENCLRIPIQDAFEMVYMVPIYLASTAGINSLWFCPEESCVYTHRKANLSEKERNRIVEDIQKLPFKKGHPILWKKQKLQKTSSTTVAAANRQVKPNDEVKVVKCETQDKKKAEIMKASDNFDTPFILETLKCQVCYKYYNLLERQPITLVPCGHSICSRCIRKTHSCPDCHCLIAIGIVTIALLGTMRALQDGGFVAAETKPFGKVTMKQANKEDRATSPRVSIDHPNTLDRGSMTIQKDLQDRSTSPITSINLPNARDKEEELKQEPENSGNGNQEANAPKTVQTETKKPKTIKVITKKRKDKSKLVIRGLSRDFTTKDVIQKMFCTSNGLLKYEDRYDISLRTEEGSLTCFANFINREEANMARNKTLSWLMRAGLHSVKVDYLEIDEEKGENEEDETGSSNSSSKTFIRKSLEVDRSCLFISGLPLRFSENDVIQVILGRRKYLDYTRERKPITLQSTGKAQNCVAYLKNEFLTRQCISKWNSCVVENDLQLMVEYLGVANRDFSKNYAPLDETLAKSSEEEWKDIQEFLQHSIDYEKKVVISGFPSSFSRSDVRRSLLKDGFDQSAYGNLYLKNKGAFQNALLYFKEESMAKELQKCWHRKCFEDGMPLTLKLLDIDDKERAFEDALKDHLVDLDVYRGAKPRPRARALEEARRYYDVDFPTERHPFKLFISGIPDSFSFEEIVEEILWGEENIATNEGKLAILVGDTLDRTKNCTVRFKTKHHAAKMLQKTRDLLINNKYRLFAEYFGDAQRCFRTNYGTRVS